jgi:hypothetical protein
MPESSGSGVYLYALVRSSRRPSLAGAPAGLPHTGPLRAVEAGDGLWLVAAAAPLDRYGEAAIEAGLKDLDWVAACAMAHEGVVRHVCRRRTAVPMRLYTLFRSDDRAREHVQKSRVRMVRALDRVEGCEEWGVRIFAEEAPRPKPAARPAGADAGRRFLEGKRALHRAARDTSAAGVRAARTVVKDLAGTAREHRPLPVPKGAPGSRLVAGAAFLVPVTARARFQARAVRAAAEARARGLRVDVTGPWPPYNFTEPRR